jgi:WD40 repeat protein
LITLASSKDVTKAILNVWNVQRPGQKPFTVTINEELSTFIQPNINLLAISPDSSTVAIGTQSGLLLGHLNTTGKTPAWKQIGEPLPLDSNGSFQPSIGEVAWSPDGRYVAAVLTDSPDDAIVGVWDSTRQYQAVISQLAQASVPTLLTNLAWSPTARSPLLALGGNDGRVYLWSVGSSPNSVRILPESVGSTMTSLAWSGDGHWLAASYSDPAETILIWRI